MTQNQSYNLHILNYIYVESKNIYIIFMLNIIERLKAVHVLALKTLMNDVYVSFTNYERECDECTCMNIFILNTSLFLPNNRINL